MADYRLSVQTIGRAQGRSVVAAAAYRAGEELVCDRTAETWDFTRKTGVVGTEIMAPDNAPPWAMNRNRLWDEVEAAERRKDAQTAREIQVSLPHELTHEQRRELVREFVRDEIVARGMVADVAYHLPNRHGDQRNHHAHILVTTRAIGPEGFGPKEREWNSKATLESWRAQWAAKQNRALQSALGKDAPQVSHRSLSERGAERLATKHLGPAQAALERRGVSTDRGSYNRAARAFHHRRRENDAELGRLQQTLSPNRPRPLTEVLNELGAKADAVGARLQQSREALERVLAEQKQAREAVHDRNKEVWRERMKERVAPLQAEARKARQEARTAEAKATGGNPILQMMAANAHPIVFAMRKFEQATAAMLARIKANDAERAVRNARFQVRSEKQAEHPNTKIKRNALRTEERRERRAFARARRDAAQVQRMVKMATELGKAGTSEVQATKTPFNDKAYMQALETALRADLAAAQERDRQAKAVPAQPRSRPRRHDEEHGHEW